MKELYDLTLAERAELHQKIDSATNERELEDWTYKWSKEHDFDFHDIWSIIVKSRFIKKRTIEAIDNTFSKFPSVDRARVKNSDYDWIKSHIRIDDVNGELRVGNIYGVEIDSRITKDCSCFALRYNKHNDSYYRLLTTFDFKTITEENGAKSNMVWGAGFSTKWPAIPRQTMPGVLYYSLEDFIQTYMNFTSDEFTHDRLIIMDDTPEE